MSKLKACGFDITQPLKWLNAQKTAAQAMMSGYPFGIDQTATPEQWAALAADIASGAVIVDDMQPPTPPSEAAIAAAVRAERDRRLVDSDWTQLPDVPLPNKAAWAEYRQALRDITTQPDQANVTWPAPPSTS